MVMKQGGPAQAQCFARASRPAFCQPGRGALLRKPCTDRYYLVTASEGNPDGRKLRNYQYKATDTYISSKIYSSFSYIFCYVIQLLRCISNVIQVHWESRIKSFWVVQFRKLALKNRETNTLYKTHKSWITFQNSTSKLRILQSPNIQRIQKEQALQ